jgi:hypothetical protein
MADPPEPGTVSERTASPSRSTRSSPDALNAHVATMHNRATEAMKRARAVRTVMGRSRR